jgi:hypothetical protein
MATHPSVTTRQPSPDAGHRSNASPPPRSVTVPPHVRLRLCLIFYGFGEEANFPLPCFSSPLPRSTLGSLWSPPLLFCALVASTPRRCCYLRVSHAPTSRANGSSSSQAVGNRLCRRRVCRAHPRRRSSPTTLRPHCRRQDLHYGAALLPDPRDGHGNPLFTPSLSPPSSSRRRRHLTTDGASPTGPAPNFTSSSTPLSPHTSTMTLVAPPTPCPAYHRRSPLRRVVPLWRAISGELMSSPTLQIVSPPHHSAPHPLPHRPHHRPVGAGPAADTDSAMVAPLFLVLGLEAETGLSVMSSYRSLSHHHRSPSKLCIAFRCWLRHQSRRAESELLGVKLREALRI